MDVIIELVNDMFHSTPQGTVGVIGIFAYMAVILATALYRIRKGDPLHH